MKSLLTLLAASALTFTAMADDHSQTAPEQAKKEDCHCKEGSCKKCKKKGAKCKCKHGEEKTEEHKAE
jgi:hypothetical protein